jgi:hypothetical protein
MAIPPRDVERESSTIPFSLSAWDARLAAQGKSLEGTDDPWADLRFDRVASQDLMAELEEGGQFHDLIERRVKSEIADVQLRREQRGKRSWASLYIGLTSVLDLDERGGQFRLRAHATHKKAGQFDEAWATWQSADKLAAHWLGVNAYLDRLLAADGIAERLWRREGVIQAALASGQSTAYGAVQREAVVSFPSQAARLRAVRPVQERIWAAVAATGRSDAWWPGIRNGGILPPLGDEADLVAVDSAGRLLVIEAKPADELKGLVWAPAQVRLYAELFAALIDSNCNACDVLNVMASQRSALGMLDDRWKFQDRANLRVVPVIAVGPGPLSLSPVALDRLARVSAALECSPPFAHRIDPLEVWLLDSKANPIEIWYPATEPVPTPKSLTVSVGAHGRGSSFVAQARTAALAWKESTPSLPESARKPGAYGGGRANAVCLPPDQRRLNLLADARDVALSRFEAAEIRWHGGDDHEPSNHLLSSQVQCVNALAPFVDRPDDLKRIFGSVLPIDEVLPFDAPGSSPYERTDHVVFEWPGLVSHINEWTGSTPSRGAYSTSLDAAIRYRTTAGRIEIGLIEWKYIERYSNGHLSGDSEKQATRRERYIKAFSDPEGPIRGDLFDYEEYFFEPIYQLFRQQLLAWRMEQAHELGADIVRVVLVAPGANSAFWDSLPTVGWRELAGGDPFGVVKAFASVLRRPDRFCYLDSATLVDQSSPLGDDFKARYGHLGSTIGLPKTELSATHGPDGGAVEAALARTDSFLMRVSGEGSVLRNVIDAGPEFLNSLDPATRSELVARASELVELAKRFRAAPLFAALTALDIEQHT